MSGKEDSVGYSEVRPWGEFETIALSREGEELYKVKRITIMPGKRLSLQSHEKRSERWVCVSGVVTVESESYSGDLGCGLHVSIPKGTTHRMANNTSGPAVVIEVQTGEYLGEDDIIRYDDDYGRSTT